MIRLLNLVVCATRTFDDYTLLRDNLDRLTKLVAWDVLVHHGGELELARMLGKWCRERWHNQLVYRPDWKEHGKQAGVLRSVEMFDAAGPDARVVAFWDGVSKGCGHEIQMAKRRGLKLKVVRYGEE